MHAREARVILERRTSPEWDDNWCFKCEEIVETKKTHGWGAPSLCGGPVGYGPHPRCAQCGSLVGSQARVMMDWWSRGSVSAIVVGDAIYLGEDEELEFEEEE